MELDLNRLAFRYSQRFLKFFVGNFLLIQFEFARFLF